MKRLSDINRNLFKKQSLPIGTHADIKANVDMNKVAGGIFSSNILAQKFIDLGLKDIFKNFNSQIKYIDFGGGEGYLTSFVEKYLVKMGACVECLLVDANEVYLDNASKKHNLNTLKTDLKSFKKNDVDLITMRSVNHYNTITEQKLIIRNVYTSLKSNAYFVAQILSAEPVDCDVVSSILNLDSLGRTKVSQFHITSTEEFVKLSHTSGFHEVEHLGNIIDYIWTPRDSWKRFNQCLENKFSENEMKKEYLVLKEREQLFIEESQEIIRKHKEKVRNSSFNEKFEIRLFFPLIRSHKK